MRALLLLLCVAAAALAADPSTTPAPVTANPADTKATDEAKKKYEEAVGKENEAQKKLEEGLEAENKCQKDLAAAKTKAADADKYHQLIAKMTFKGTTPAMATEQKKYADPADPAAGTLGAAKKAADDAVKKLEDTSGAAPAGACPDAKKAVEPLKKAVEDAKTATDAAKTDLDEKQKKAAPSSATPAPGGAAKSQATKDAEEAQEKARKANEKLVKAYEKANGCPAAVQALDPSKAPPSLALDAITALLAQAATITAPDAAAKTADEKTLNDGKKVAEEGVTAAKQPQEDKKKECEKAAEELKAAKEEAQKAKEDAEYKMKVANDPSLQTTAGPTTAAATTAASGATTAASGATTAASGATTAASGATAAVSGATTPAPADAKKNEGPDATESVDGVPLSPSTPCCQKAAAGLCKVSILVRNTCNTECGCTASTGTCTGDAPKKCKDASGGPPPAPKPPACSDKNQNCGGWKDYCSAGKQGYYVLQNCAKSCDKCSCGGDVDAFHCWAWAFLGECQNPSYKDWMQKYCGLSCCDKKAGSTSGLSLAQRRKIVNRIARARTLKRIRAARLSKVAKIKRRRAKAARAALAKKAGSRSFLKARAARRRRMRIAKAKAQARRARLNN